jgi:amidase
MDILLGKNSPIKEELQWEISQGLQVSDEELLQASEIRNSYAEYLDGLFQSYDVLALPSAQLFPFPHEWKWPKEVGGEEMDTYHRWMQVCVPVTLGGLPCSTIPAGFGPKGLPIGIQLFTQRGKDAKGLQIAQAYHSIIDWPSNVEVSTSAGSILTSQAL